VTAGEARTAAVLGSAGHAQDNACILLQSGSPLPHGAFAMCQLLGMNCATPTDVTFSFTGFAARGGVTDHHSDGFGVAFFETRPAGCSSTTSRRVPRRWPT